jgi:hypothetical protein
MRGRDPRIHPILRPTMDCRVETDDARSGRSEAATESIARIGAMDAKRQAY